MLSEHLEIKSGVGEYKDFPYKKGVYLYGHCVWEDDFPTNISNKRVLKEFIKELTEIMECM